MTDLNERLIIIPVRDDVLVVDILVDDISSDKPEEDIKMCRICLNYDDLEYISPCLCKGTMKYVHRECLNEWRNSENKLALNNCTECKFKYEYKSTEGWEKLCRIAQIKYICYSIIMNELSAIIFTLIIKIIDQEYILSHKLHGIWFPFYHIIGWCAYVTTVGSIIAIVATMSDPHICRRICCCICILPFIPIIGLFTGLCVMPFMISLKYANIKKRYIVGIRDSIIKDYVDLIV
jgi:hypothetical protein